MKVGYLGKPNGGFLHLYPNVTPQLLIKGITVHSHIGF